MDANCTRMRRGRRRMEMSKILSTLVLWLTALTLFRTCVAYTIGPPMRITTTKETFGGFPSTRRNVFRRSRSHQRSMTNNNMNGMALNDNNDDDGDDKPIYGFAEEEARDGSRQYDDWLFDSRKQRVAFYGSLAFLETVFWYWLAPGIDPQSRWFNPLDGKLIACLLDPSTVFSPPEGSGLGFSSLLLNTFLILPMVWSLLLLQEENDDDVSSGNHFNDSIPGTNLSNRITTAIKTCVCACGFLVGGGILIPYMIFRRPMPFRRSIDPKKFPAPLRLFEEQNKYQNSASNSVPFIEPIGQALLLLLVSVVLISFLLPLANHNCDWIGELNAFMDRARSSQFTALALYDFTMISIAVLDPMMDDAIRRGYVIGWETGDENHISTPESGARSNNDANRDRWRTKERANALMALAPYVAIPLIGPVLWIYARPRYDVGPTK